MEKIKAMKKIKEEFMSIKSSPIENIGVTVGLPNEDNIFEWKCTLKGPRDSSYAGGLFFLRIIFPDNYPTKPPEVCFITPIYHLNVNPRKTELERLGHVCINTLNWWNPKYNMKKILTEIFALFYMANYESPYGLDRAEEFRKNNSLYEKKVKYFTSRYANPRMKEYTDINNNWDFSYCENKNF